ncbi:MAG TPA: DUF4317 family protein [Lachnospiraceae bacterium]|nr:DUF4317 family protein [Lachnospiraceae bacterium]
MISREDMLELTRRMTIDRTSFTRIAGSYLDKDGLTDGTFNTNFLKLKASERQKKLLVAKTIPFSNTNENLKDYHFSKDKIGNGSIWQLLQAMRLSGLKDDVLLDTFYELIAEKYQTTKDYTIIVFHDRYDVPMKAADKERLGESEEVFEYIICAVCPLTGEYEPGEPEFGFLFPLFTDRSADIHAIGLYNKNKEFPHRELEELLLQNEKS